MKHNWEYKRLGELCDILPGTRIVKKETEPGEYFVYGGGDATFTTQNYNRENAIIVARFALSQKCTRFVKGKFFLNDSGLTLVPKEASLDFNFLKWHIFALNDKIYELSRGAAQKNLDMKRFPLLPLFKPSFPEQEMIVAELDEINELIATRKEQLKELDNLAQSLFYDTFGDPITNPKGWEVKRIGDLTQVLTGATPSRDDASNFSGTIPWVKTTEVQNCDILSTEECISEDALKNTNCKLLPKNSILVAMYGQGRTRGQIARLRIEASTNQACAAILPSKNLKQSFLYEFLHVSYEPLRNLAIGCNQKNLNLKLIKDFFIILPPLSLQQQFAAQVEAIEAQKGVLNESLKELQTLLDSRMDYWFN